MDLTAVQAQNTTNYLVPSSGSTHAVPISQAWPVQPTFLDWRQFSESSFPFQPQGVFIDNTLNAQPLTINVQPVNWNVTCPANVQMMIPFPAPSGQTMNVSSGGGQATLIFVDFPVLPFQTNPSGSIGSVTTQPVNVDTGLPLQSFTAQGAGTTTSLDQINNYAVGVKVVINITSLNAGAPTIQVTVQGKDKTSGVYYTILQSTALAAVGTTVLDIYPGLIPAANLTANDTIPSIWRVSSTIVAGTGSITGTIGASTIPA
jgi:hypothetical protein